jgi:sucrose-6F-phosphate phosphohydrolase
MQPEKFQGEHKVSYYLTDASRSELAQIRSRLADAGVDADIVYSSQRDLDVLPAGIDKGSAAAFLAEYLEYEPEEVIVCGDSANDLAMFQHGFRGIVVGNAHDDLTDLRGPGVYISEFECAAGLLDGLNHWLVDGVETVRERAG